jgi:hypothetical protein
MDEKNNDVLYILYYTKKGMRMDNIKKICIYWETIQGNQQNDKYTVTSNKSFESLQKGEVIWLTFCRPGNHPSLCVIRHLYTVRTGGNVPTRRTSMNFVAPYEECHRQTSKVSTFIHDNKCLSLKYLKFLYNILALPILLISFRDKQIDKMSVGMDITKYPSII